MSGCHDSDDCVLLTSRVHRMRQSILCGQVTQLAPQMRGYNIDVHSIIRQASVLYRGISLICRRRVT